MTSVLNLKLIKLDEIQTIEVGGETYLMVTEALLATLTGGSAASKETRKPFLPQTFKDDVLAVVEKEGPIKRSDIGKRLQDHLDYKFTLEDISNALVNLRGRGAVVSSIERGPGSCTWSVPNT